MANPRKITSSSSLSCLPDEMVLNCLVRVPRSYYNNISCVSQRLRSLVRSPELYRMRSLLHQDSVYICFAKRFDYSTDAILWFTLRPTTKPEYQLVPIPFPCRDFMFISSTVAVDSDIYFLGGRPNPTELWILDTRSGTLRQGPMKQDSRIATSSNVVGLFGGKIYVIQELNHGEIVEQVFDIESQTWKAARVENGDPRPLMASSVSLEGKVYAMHNERIIVFNLRQGTRKENKPKMPIKDWVYCICVANNLLFAFFNHSGLMWLDTKLNVWRVVCGDVQTLHRKLYASVMAEYYGKLALFWREIDIDTTTTTTSTKNKNKKKKEEENIWCALIALDRVGDEVHGTIHWSGVVATIPYICRFLHCLVASD